MIFGQGKTMSNEERAANLLQCRLSWPLAEACARDLANAGLLAPDTTDTA